MDVRDEEGLVLLLLDLTGDGSGSFKIALGCVTMRQVVVMVGIVVLHELECDKRQRLSSYANG